MKKKLLSTMLTATMLVGMLSGCGSTGDDANPTPSNAPESTPTPAPKADDPTPTEAPAANQGEENTQQPDDTQQPGNDALQSLLNIDTLENPNIVVDLYELRHCMETVERFYRKRCLASANMVCAYVYVVERRFRQAIL